MPAPPPLARDAALFLDLDGTLLEIAPRPELVRVPDGLPALLARLAAQRDGALAVVSGRRLADVDLLLAPWRGAVAALHGSERRRGDGSFVRAEADDAVAALEELRDPLRLAAAPRPGVWLEDKGETLALHYRAAPEREAELRDLAARLVAEAGDRLRLIAGKMVLEVQPRHHNKGAAIAAFLREPPFCGRQPVFVGDDTTDEDGFREVNRRGGVSVRVGPRATTAAACELPSVGVALDWLRAAAADRPSVGTR
ncbi:MAG: trehalose-phosphatase [Thiohalocapsa sp.]